MLSASVVSATPNSHPLSLTMIRYNHYDRGKPNGATTPTKTPIRGYAKYSVYLPIYLFCLALIAHASGHVQGEKKMYASPRHGKGPETRTEQDVATKKKTGGKLSSSDFALTKPPQHPLCLLLMSSLDCRDYKNNSPSSTGPGLPMKNHPPPPHPPPRERGDRPPRILGHTKMSVDTGFWPRHWALGIGHWTFLKEFWPAKKFFFGSFPPKNPATTPPIQVVWPNHAYL